MCFVHVLHWGFFCFVEIEHSNEHFLLNWIYFYETTVFDLYENYVFVDFGEEALVSERFLFKDEGFDFFEFLEVLWCVKWVEELILFFDFSVELFGFLIINL